MGKIDQTGRGKFTITYGGLESPMAGIDAKHESGLYLNPNSLAAAGGFISQDGYLNTVFLNPRVSVNLSAYGINPAYVIGDVQVISVTQGTAPYVTRQSWGFIVVSSATTLTVLEFHNGFVNGVSNTISIGANQATNLTWYTINGVVYITGLGLGAIYAYTPYAPVGSTLLLLTNYVGGQYLGELNGRLLVAGCDQIVSGVYSYYPFQISWSAGSGNYSQWNPLVGGLVTGAGYNNLPDVADEIVGFFTIGPTGYIIRKQGITEMTPLNSGIQPFDFNHLWASQKGIGSVFPNSVVQYGSLGGFLSDIGVFTMGYSGIKQIEGDFWAEINRLLDNLSAQSTANYPPNYTTLLASVVAGLLPLYINNERKLVYALYIPTQDGLLFLGDIESKDWNSVSCFTNATPFTATITGASGGQIQPSSQKAFLGIGSDQSIACMTGLFGNGLNQLCLFSLDDTLILPFGVNPPPFVDSTPFGVFPIEEVVMNRDITIDAISVIADAVVTAPAVITLEFQLENPDGKILAEYSNVTFNGNAQYKISYPSSNIGSTANNIFTGRYPQLTLTAIMDNINSSSLRVYKIVMYCSFDPDQAP